MAQHSEQRVGDAHYQSLAGVLPEEEEVNLGDDELNVHVASLAEKKRLWWRNALINMSFIAAWYALSLLLCFMYILTQSTTLLKGLSSLLSSPCTTSGCSLRTTMDFPSLSSSRPYTCLFSSFSLHSSAMSSRASFVRITTLQPLTTRECYSDYISACGIVFVLYLLITQSLCYCPTAWTCAVGRILCTECIDF